jgi:hypothetical protein
MPWSGRFRGTRTLAVSRDPDLEAPQVSHRNACPEHLALNEGVTGSNPVSSTERPGQGGETRIPGFPREAPWRTRVPQGLHSGHCDSRYEHLALDEGVSVDLSGRSMTRMPASRGNGGRRRRRFPTCRPATRAPSATPCPTRWGRACAASAAPSRQGSTWMDPRMARISATSVASDAGDQFASITRRVPSTSRIQNSSTGSAL